MAQGESHFYAVGDNTLHYIVIGRGPELLIAFHGFGDNAQIFRNIEASLTNKYTIVSVDLPFHGLSHWTEDEPLTCDQLLKFIRYLLNVFQKEQFDLAGFSLGGKVSLAIYHALPAQVNTLWLFAPDGLKNNIWYNIAVYPKAGRWFFRRIMQQPEWFIVFIRFLGYLRLVRRQYVQFIEKQLATESKRELVWQIWMCLKGYERKRDVLRAQIKHHHTRLYVFMGRYDHIIKTSFAKKFCRALPTAELIILDKGHYLLKEYLNTYIAKRL